MEDKKLLQAQNTNMQKAWLIGLIAWFFPGAGHFAQRKFGRGAILSLIIISMFVAGLMMGGKLSMLWENDPNGSFLLGLLKSFANVGNGVIYMVCIFFGIGIGSDLRSAETFTFEYGNTFTLVSGLLNYLVALDAFDTFVGRKE
jgi:hypothetical protein